MKTQVRKNKKLAPSLLDKGEVYHDYEIRIKSNLYRNNLEFMEIFPLFFSTGKSLSEALLFGEHVLPMF